MKFKHLYLTTLLIILCAVAGAAQQPGEIVTKYDRFAGITTLRIRPMLVSGTLNDGLALAAILAYSDKESPKNGLLTLEIVSISNEWRYLYDRELTLIIDGERVAMGQMKRDNAVVSPEVRMEDMTLRLDYNMLRRIAHAKKIEGRLGSREFVLRPEHLDALLDLVSRMSL